MSASPWGNFLRSSCQSPTLFCQLSSSVTHVGYKSSQFDQLVRQADADANPESRDKTYLQASQLLSKDAAAAW